MNFFKNKNSESKENEGKKKKSVEKNSDKKKEEPKIYERPRICCIDLKSEILESLKLSGFNIYPGSLGDKIKIPNSNHGDSHEVLLDFDLPPNIHEYDIFIIDLENSKTIEYDPEDHKRKYHSGKSSISLLSSYPETIFDPRPLSSFLLENQLNQMGNREHMIIVFTSGEYDIEYESIKIEEDYRNRQRVEKYNIYSFDRSVPLGKKKYGEEIAVCEIKENVQNFFESYIHQTTYNQTFYHPTEWKNDERVPKSNYVPLFKNFNDDIVSIFYSEENSIFLYLPQIEPKEKFLTSFLKEIGPSIVPELFPHSTTFEWKNRKEYWLPNHRKLLGEKKEIENEFEKKLRDKEDEITYNQKHYSFLHELITETGDQLVRALVKYFKWLGFDSVINYDEKKQNDDLLEEDIQIDIDKGLLIIECKGIGGTSTDSDCSQISKIKHRRCKERNSFDVYALYIVNHQRYIPPLKRVNPPFTEVQIQDAINDERGLLSTWQLFNLYFEIEDGIIDKSEARTELLKFGLVEFKPKNLEFIDKPTELFKNGHICIVNIDNIELKIGDEIFVEKDNKFEKMIIESIQVQDKPQSSVDSGEIGLQLSKPIKKKSILWKRSSY